MIDTEHSQLAAASMTRLHPVEATMERLALGKSTVYALIRSGELRSVKVGKRRLIPESAIAEFIERLEFPTDPADHHGPPGR